MTSVIVIGFLLVLAPHPHEGKMQTYVYPDAGSCMLRAQHALDVVGYERASCIPLFAERET